MADHLIAGFGVEAPAGRPVPAADALETPHRSQKPRVVLLVADLAIAQAFCLLSLELAGGSGSGADVVRPVAPIALSIVLALLFPAIVGVSGLYRRSYLMSWRRQAEIGLRVLAWFAAALMGALFLFAEEIPWELRRVLFLYQGMLAVWLLALRPPAGALLSRQFAVPRTERVLVVGDDRLALKVARGLEQSSRHVRILGFSSPARRQLPASRPFFQSELEDLPALAAEMDVDLVVVARPDLPREQVILLSDALVAAGRRVHVVSNVFNHLVDSLPFETDHGVPLVPLGHTPLRDAEEKAKRIFDLVGTVLGGILISPLLLTIAVLVKLSSPGPILFRQERMGKHGRTFAFYKFRSMTVQNDDSAHRAYVTELMTGGDPAALDREGKPVFKIADDPRITRIGRLLRRTSLDELPQLINVLRGEMSLIGPRPCLPFEYDLYKDWQKRRLDVTPGMTGLWQVTGRSYVCFEDMVLLDLFYIANWSFAMDLKILLRTVPVVIWGKGGV